VDHLPATHSKSAELTNKILDFPENESLNHLPVTNEGKKSFIAVTLVRGLDDES
jgi:hypothetical protein